MNVALILDREALTPLSEHLESGVLWTLCEKGHSVDVFELTSDDARPCLGCLRCLTRHPGECVTKDVVGRIIRNRGKYDLTVYFSPIVFGHFSSTMKNALDRGTGSHNWQVNVGIGEDADEEEESTFIDLTARHRGKADIVHPGMDRQVDVFVVKSAEDCATVCDALARGA